MRFSALLFKNERTKSKASRPVKDVKSNKKQSIASTDKSKAGMRPLTHTSKANTKPGLKDKMKSCFTQMRISGVPKHERRTSMAYALAFLHTKIALEDDEQATSMDFDDTEETQVTMVASDGSIPAVMSDPENDQRTTVIATSTSGRDVNISWTRPADLSSLSSDSLADSKASSESDVTFDKNDPITYTNGASNHTIHVRDGIRLRQTVRPPHLGKENNFFGQPERPFNHFPQEPRPRPRGLRRENAFCHKSHYEIFWHPGFGDYNKPPTTAEEALPVHYFRPHNESNPTSVAPSSFPATPHASSNDETTNTATPATMPATTCASSAGGTNSSEHKRPFNHFLQEPRPRPRGLRRENAFCHKSHYEIFWHPGFGDYDKPPMTVEEALPDHYFRHRNESTSTSATTSSSPSNYNHSSNDETTTTATPPTILGSTSCIPSTAPFVSRKRARDNESSGDNSDEAPPRHRARSI